MVYTKDIVENRERETIMTTLTSNEMTSAQMKNFNAHDYKLIALPQSSFEKTYQDANQVTFTLTIGRKVIRWTYRRNEIVRTLAVNGDYYMWTFAR